MPDNTLPELPDVQFVETDAQQIIDDIISGYEQMAGYTLGDSDPRRLFLLSIAQIIIQQRQMIDASGKSNLLYYAEDELLDHLGAMRDLERIEAEPAVTTQRFTLSSVRPSNVGIPQGTRVTADNELYFETAEPATIVAGDTTVDVQVVALTPGSDGNGIPEDTITNLVDPVPYVASTTNTEATSGGGDREEDDAYRARIYRAPSGFSIAGPREAYIAIALAASSSIVNVVAYSPSAGVVEIRPTLEGGQMPSQAVLDLVETACSADTARPLTDQVNVLAPDEVNYTVDITYYVRTQDAPSASDIQSRVDQAVDDYVEWQHSRIGRDINPDELVARVIGAGAKRVEITNPSYQVLPDTEIAINTSVTANYGGTEDD